MHADDFSKLGQATGGGSPPTAWPSGAAKPTVPAASTSVAVCTGATIGEGLPSASSLDAKVATGKAVSLPAESTATTRAEVRVTSNAKVFPRATERGPRRAPAPATPPAATTTTRASPAHEIHHDQTRGIHDADQRLTVDRRRPAVQSRSEGSGAPRLAAWRPEIHGPACADGGDPGVGRDKGPDHLLGDRRTRAHPTLDVERHDLGREPLGSALHAVDHHDAAVVQRERRDLHDHPPVAHSGSKTDARTEDADGFPGHVDGDDRPIRQARAGSERGRFPTPTRACSVPSSLSSRTSPRTVKTRILPSAVTSGALSIPGPIERLQATRSPALGRGSRVKPLRRPSTRSVVDGPLSCADDESARALGIEALSACARAERAEEQQPRRGPSKEHLARSVSKLVDEVRLDLRHGRRAIGDRSGHRPVHAQDVAMLEARVSAVRNAD